MRNSPEIVHLPIGEVKRSPHHARIHNRQQRRKLEALIRRFGQAVPILIDEQNVIVDGHAVHEAMQSLGSDEIAAIVVQGRDESEIRALRLALNRIPQQSTWDNEKLRQEFASLFALGFDMQFTGFDAVEIDMALSIKDPGAAFVEEENVGDLEPTGEAPLVALGDVWLLDRHAVACGDARDPDLIRRLAKERSVAVVFSDPPYNVPIDQFVSGLGQTRHREFAMASGEMKREEFVAFLSAFIAAAKPVLGDGAILFLCMEWPHVLELQLAGERQEIELKNICVWAKTNADIGSFYRSQHELVLIFKHGSGPHQNHFELGQHGRSRSNVWRYAGVNTFGKDRMELLGSHPTVKPVAMIADALKDVSGRGDLVLDPFLGSGSTLIAAEETGRTCIGIELDPGFVEVGMRRWEKRTGKDAVHAETGETFTDFAVRMRTGPAGPSTGNVARGMTAAAVNSEQGGVDAHG